MRCLRQVARHSAQRLIKAKCHVPGLAGEDREDSCGFRTRDPAGKERHEENDGEGDVTQYRHRLEDIEERNQHEFGSPAFGSKRSIGNREEQ